MHAVVLCISPAPLDGYPPTQYQAELLADAGFNVVMLTSFLGGGKNAEFAHPKIRCRRFSLGDRSFLRRQFAYLCFALTLVYYRIKFHRRLIAEIAYDPRGVFLSTILPFRSRKLVGHLHEALTSGGRFDFFERYLLRHLQVLSLVVVADAQRAVLLQKQAGRSLNIKTVRNVPLLKTLVQLGSAVADGGEQPFSVVYHGSLGPEQSIDTTIESMPFWPAAVRFHIYGNPGGERRKELEALANRLGVADRLQFEGWVRTTGLMNKLQRHSVGLSFMKPTTDNRKCSAGASNKRYQYMQAGLPQISDDNPDVRELVEGNRVGFCVPLDNPRAIAEKINLLCQDRALRAEMGRRGRQLYETEFHYEKEFAPVLKFILEKTNDCAPLNNTTTTGSPCS